MIGRPQTSAVLIALASLGCLACGGDTDPAMSATVTDSAGVRLVDHPAGVGPAFSIGSAPTLTLELDPSDVPLFQVVGGYIGASDYVVADAGNYRLVRWSHTGELLSTSGSQGSGPGEFQNIMWLQPTEGGSATYDARSRRISWFDRDLRYRSSIPFDVERPDPPTDDAIVASGAALGVVSGSRVVGYPLSYADPVGAEGPLPLSADLAVLDSTSAPLRSLGKFMLMEWYEDPDREGFPIVNRMETPRVHWSGHGDVLAIADAIGHRVDIIEGGERKTVIREAGARLPFAPDSIPDQFELAVDSLQAYRDVRVDGLGRVWVQSATPPESGGVRWRVFATDGTRIGDLTLPADATVLDAAESTVLLLRRSELDEESAEVWELIDPS